MSAAAMMDELAGQVHVEEAADSGGEIGGMDVGIDVDKLPEPLKELVARLRAVPPTIEIVDLGGPDQGGDYFRLDPAAADLEEGAAGLRCSSVRLWVLGLIGSCASLWGVNLGNCGISSEAEVERLCQGLKANQALRRLQLDGNVGFGSEFGCGQVSDILASSSTSLERLQMDGVGLKAAGLSQLLSTLLANNTGTWATCPQTWSLQVLDLERNPECLADERAAQLLAQLVSRTKGLRDLRIRETGLAVAGAALLSAALGAKALHTLQVGGGPELILNVIVSSLGRCSELVLLFSKEEEEASQVAEPLAQMLRTNTSLTYLKLEGAHFSTQAWNGIFQALGAANSTLSFLSLGGSTTLDHSVKDDLHQLIAGNPGLRIVEITDAPLKGTKTVQESRWFFYCTCSSCRDSMGEGSMCEGSGGEILNVERLHKQLRPLIAALTVPPLIEEVDLNGPDPDHAAVGNMLRLNPENPRVGSSMLWELRLLVLGLIGKCPSLRRVRLNDCYISRESEALCSGLASNPVLEELTLDWNRGFGSNFGCQQLATVVSGCSATLRKISLQHVGLKSSGLFLLIYALLATRLGGSTSITEMELDISYNHELGDVGAHLVAQLLSSPTTSVASSLTTLKILNLGMDVSGATSLARALQHNTNLRTLCVGEVRFQPEEWRKIFKALERNEVLKVLDIRNSYDLKAVFNDLMELLQVNTTIEEIRGLEKTDLRAKGEIPQVQEALWRNKRYREYVNVLKDELKLPLAQPSTGRLFLCGPPHAGKSTLRETMVRCHQQPRCGCTGELGAFMFGQWGLRSLRPRTEGIEIQVLRKDDEMQISIWDMAQEEYHALHGYIFPTTNQACIFVFVYNPFQKKGRNASSHADAVELPTDDFYDKLMYWLRFLASNLRCQGHVLPKVCIVITNLDGLHPKYSQDDVLKWATPVVDELRLKFEGVLQVSACISVVKGYSTVSVQPLVDHVFLEFQELLEKNLSPVFQACGEMSLALARLTMHQNAKVAPMLRLEEFYKLCSEEVDALRDLFQDQPPISDYAVERYVSKARAAVAAYLHDVGSIIYFEELKFVVVNPNWLNNVFLSKFVRSRANTPGVRLLPETYDGVIEEFELRRILERFLKNSQPPCPGFVEDDLLQLLLKLEFCYKLRDSTNRPVRGMVRYFVPSSLTRKQLSNLKWEVPLQGPAKCLPIGIRLQCDANSTKFLTAGFFPRLQVCLGKEFVEEFVEVDNGYDLIRIRMNGCEILVESSGEDNATFVDILVQSAKPKDEIWDLVQKYIIEKIQAFCATPSGCPGIILQHYIIRPGCVVDLIPCLERHVVSVETLKKDLINDIMSKIQTQATSTDFAVTTPVVEDASGIGSIQHTWPHSAGYDSAVELLDAQSVRDISRKVMADLNEKINSLAEAESQISQAVNEVTTTTPEGQPVETMVPSKSIRKEPTMERKLDTLYDEMHKRFDGVEKRLDEQKELLSQIVPSLTMELKLQQRQLQETLLSGVNKVMSFMRDSQKSKLPRFPYLAKGGVGIGQRFVAFVTLANASKLHFMCEDRTGMHYVKNQPGCDLTINKPGHETLRFVILCSVKILYILVKAGLQVGTGLGGIVPEIGSSEGVAVPISSRVMADVLNDISLKDPSHFSAQSEVDELAQLHYFLKSTGNDNITEHFQLHRVEYLHYDATGKLPKFGWVCQKCRERGKTNNSLMDSPP